MQQKLRAVGNLTKSLTTRRRDAKTHSVPAPQLATDFQVLIPAQRKLDGR